VGTSVVDAGSPAGSGFHGCLARDVISPTAGASSGRRRHERFADEVTRRLSGQVAATSPRVIGARFRQDVAWDGADGLVQALAPHPTR
jgi:hypothetical protein